MNKEVCTKIVGSITSEVGFIALEFVHIREKDTLLNCIIRYSTPKHNTH